MNLVPRCVSARASVRPWEAFVPLAAAGSITSPYVCRTPAHAGLAPGICFIGPKQRQGVPFAELRSLACRSISLDMLMS